MLKFKTYCATLVAVLLMSQAMVANAQLPDFTGLVEAASPAVVNISTRQKVPQRLLRLRCRAAALSVQCFIAPLSILCDAGIVICSLRTVASTSEVLPSSKLMLMGTRSPSFSSLFISISMM